MKVNLIYDIRHEDESWFDKFSKEDRGQAVLDVLESARHKDELGKIINGLKRPEETIQRIRVDIEKLLTNKQKFEFNNLKTKFNLTSI